MRDVTVRVEGARELRRTLRQAGMDLHDLKDVHAAVGAVVVAAGQAGAPRRSGSLATTVRANRAATKVTIMAGYASVPYAGVIHWGWPRRNIHPQPWLSDAATRTEPVWQPLYMTRIDQVLAKVRGA